MLEFQAYQIAFAAHVRDPKNNPKPKGVPKERMAVYTHGVFHNVFEAVSACFPVCQTILGDRAWRQLVKQYFAEYGAPSPIFREIPEGFLAFLDEQTTTELPVFFKQLAHYEWAELGVTHMPIDHITLSKTTDLLNEQPILTNAHMLLAYDYPVHTISKQNQPTETTPTFILMYRDAEFEVQFIVLNAMTYELLSLLEQGVSGKQALEQIAVALQHPKPEKIVKFGLTMLQDLLGKSVVIGTLAV